jgi:dipeptidyl aminopeptidase/acylaminoacyl peptidase
LKASLRASIHSFGPIALNVVAALALSAGSAAAQTAPDGASLAPQAVLPPASSFFSAPTMSHARLSPTGQVVAYVRSAPDGKSRTLRFFDLNTRKPLAAVSLDAHRPHQLTWVSDRRVALTLHPPTSTVDPLSTYSSVFAVDQDGQRVQRLDRLTAKMHWNDGTTLIYPITLDDGANGDQALALPENHVIVHRRAGAMRGEAWLIDTVRETAERIDSPKDGFPVGFDVQGQARLALSGPKDGAEKHLKVRWPGQAAWEDPWAALLPQAQERPNQAVMFQGDLLYARRAGSEHAALYRMKGQGDKRQDDLLLRVAEFDLQPDLIVNDKQLLGLRIQADAPSTHWFDEGLRRVQEQIDAALPATVNQISVPHRGASPWVLVRAQSDQAPAALYAFNMQSAKLLRLGSEHEGLEAPAGTRTDFIRLPTRSGVQLPAYITYPRGEARKDLALVVLPPSDKNVPYGPRKQAWAWRPEVAFLASRGYAVLQPEYRGVQGFGARMQGTAADRPAASWPNRQTLAEDLQDAVKWAVTEGLADPKRVGIIATDFGAHSALITAALAPQQVAALVLHQPIFSEDMLRREWDEDQTLQRWMGPASPDANATAAPRPLLPRIQAPVMVAWTGAKNYLEQSASLISALESEKKAVRPWIYDLKRGDDVWYWTEPTPYTAKFWQAAVDFLADKGVAPATPAP